MRNINTEREDLDRVKVELLKQCDARKMTTAQKMQLINALSIFQNTASMSDSELSHYVSETIDIYLDVSASSDYQYIEGYDLGIPTDTIAFDENNTRLFFSEGMHAKDSKIVIQVEPNKDRTDSMRDEDDVRCEHDLLIARKFNITVRIKDTMVVASGIYLEAFSKKPYDSEQAMSYIEECYGYGSVVDTDFHNALLQCTDFYSEHNEKPIFERLLVDGGVRGAIAYLIEVKVTRENGVGSKDKQDAMQLASLTLSHCFRTLNMDRVSLNNTHHLYDEPKKQILSGIVLNSSMPEMVSPMFRVNLMDMFRYMTPSNTKTLVFEPAQPCCV